jgi:glycosyltransferase involved in cell wall biosynthesis
MPSSALLTPVPDAAAPGPRPATPRIDVVVPVYNEQRALPWSIRRLHDHLRDELPYDWRIVIADNASTDETPRVAAALAADLAGVEHVALEQKGRGRALRAAWLASDADVLVYMDVDLSTDLKALLPLVAPLVSGHSDVAIGTRLADGARVVRGRKRELISRGYNHLLHLTLGARFSDAQCGFKAVRADVARRLVPAVADDGWFFDTELLVLAQREGLRVHEVPVDWVDDPDSRVDVVRTALDDLRGIARLLAGARLTRFLAIGLCSTISHALLFLWLRGPLGAGAGNALALAITAVANTHANRRLTFAVRGREGLLRHHAQGALVYLFTLGLTSGALLSLDGVAPGASHGFELAVLVAANVCATATRYVALRSWIFARRGRREAARRMPAALTS